MRLILRGLCEGAVAKIFRVEEKTAGERKWKVLNLAISESVADPSDKTKYINKTVFNGFVNYGGPIKAETLTGALVVLRGVSTTSSYDKEKNKNYVNHAVSDLVILKKGDGVQSTSEPNAAAIATPEVNVTDVPVGDVGEDDFPF